MKNIMLFSLCLLLSIEGSSQLIQSQIVDQNGEGVPFAAVGIIDKNFGAITFEDGSFELSVSDEFSDDTLVVAAVGFDRLLLPYASFVSDAPKTLELTQQITKLEEVRITPEGLDYSWVGEGKKRSSSALSFLTPQKGTTLAVLMNEQQELLHLKKISVGVESSSLREFQLRAMLFSMTEDSLPGEQLLNKNLIQTSDERKGILTFSLEEALWIDQPFFVGFEWIVSKAQFEEINKVGGQYPIPFLEEIASEYPELKYTVNDNSTVQFRDLDGNLKHEVPLTKDQREEMKERGKVLPKVLFQIHYKDNGLRTITGSHITNAWRTYKFHALVSIYAGMDE